MSGHKVFTFVMEACYVDMVYDHQFDSVRLELLKLNDAYFIYVKFILHGKHGFLLKM